MSDAHILQTLRDSPELRRTLERDFEFCPLSTATGSQLFHLAPNQSFELIAKDKSGGEFALCQGELSERPLLYASSEGQAGILGRNLKEGISIIIDVPFWQDCLKFSGGGNLKEMRSAFALSIADQQSRMSVLRSGAQIVRARLALPVLEDPVQLLHVSLTQLSPFFPVYADDGSPFRGLFNKFTVMSNPAWRRRLSG